jgi:hypothetical protein
MPASLEIELVLASTSGVSISPERDERPESTMLEETARTTIDAIIA